MKLLTILLLSISSLCISQNYTYFDTFNKNEIFDKDKMIWKEVTDSSGNSMVWDVFFEKTMGEILLQDTLSKDWMYFKIVDEEKIDRDKNKEYKYSYRCLTTRNGSGDVYIYLYKEYNYLVIKIQYPNLTLRFRRLIN